jgi:hypothetical protein
MEDTGDASKKLFIVFSILLFAGLPLRFRVEVNGAVSSTHVDPATQLLVGSVPYLAGLTKIDKYYKATIGIAFGTLSHSPYLFYTHLLGLD